MAELFNFPSFASGEIAPDLWGRVDQDLYYIGLRTCRNFIVRQYGGAANRPGTRFTCESKSNSTKLRIVPFQFNELQTYVLEFGHLYMRVIKDGAEVLETNIVVSAATKANPCVLTAVAHGWANGDDIYISGIVGMVELNGRTVRVKNATANTVELTDLDGVNINSTAYSTYTSGGTAARVYTLVTPFDQSKLFDLNYAQSNDVITLVHPDYYPRDITRTGHAAWTLGLFNNNEGPFKDINTGATLLTPSAVTGGAITLTASAPLFDSSWVGELIYLEQEPSDATKRWEAGKAVVINDIRRAGTHYYKAVNAGTTGSTKPDWTEGTFTDGDSGIQWNYLHSGFGIMRVTAYTNTTNVTCTVIRRLPENLLTISSDIWARAAFSDTEGYPSALAYHKQRFILGGTKNQPNGIWMSGVGLRSEFAKGNPILDDEMISLKLDSTQQANAIRHLLPFSALIALTSGSEHLLNGNNDALLATEPPNAKVQGYTGASKVVPIIIGNTAIFVQDIGSEIRSLQYNLDSDSFTGIDLSARSPHLFRRKTVVDWAYQKHPLSVIWTVMSDGSLNGFTFMQEQKVYAWHPHETDGFYESVCTIREGNETAAYFVVKRTINGVTKRYVERLASRIFDDITDAYFMDCGLTYDGTNTGSTTMTITGGTTWDNPETLTLTASAATFKATDIGDEIVFWNGTQKLRLQITAYTSSTVVSVLPTKLIPVAYRSVARTDWSFARDVFQPLWHLEGKTVVALADGNVVEGLVVTNGKVTLPTPASKAHFGLPYTALLETLDFAQPQGKSKAITVNIPRLFITAQETRGLFVATNKFGTSGDDIEDRFVEKKPRSPDIGYDLPIPAGTDLFEVQTASAWSNKGRVAIRQQLPLPVTINAITPEVIYGS